MPLGKDESLVVIAECHKYLKEYETDHLLGAQVTKVIKKHAPFITIYDRDHIEKLMKEMNLQYSDMVDAAKKAAKAGRLGGAKKLLLVRAINFSKGIMVGLTVTFKLLEVETSEVTLQHIESPSEFWYPFHPPESEISRLLEIAVDAFAQKRLTTIKPENEQW